MNEMEEDSSWEDRRKLMGYVASDLSKIETLQVGAGDQFMLRTLVRTLFSLVDSLCWYLKCEALRGAKDKDIDFKPKIMQVLTEKRIVDGRKIQYSPSLKENIKESIKAFSVVRSGLKVPECIERMPSELDVAIKVRHRITHPKTTKEYDIADSEWKDIHKMSLWLLDVFKWQKDLDIRWIDEIRQEVSRTTNASIEKIRNNCPNIGNKKTLKSSRKKGSRQLPPYPKTGD